MTRVYRRAVLGGAVAVGLAGCLGDGLSAGDDSDDDDGDGSGGPASTDPGEYAVENYNHPGFLEDEPRFERYEDEQEALDALAERPGEIDDLETFVEETDFESAVLLEVAGHAPNLCYSFEVDSAGLEQDDDGEEYVAVETAVLDDTEADACGEEVRTVGALVRVGVDAEDVTTATLSHTDSDGNPSHASISRDSVADAEPEE